MIHIMGYLIHTSDPKLGRASNMVIRQLVYIATSLKLLIN